VISLGPRQKDIHFNHRRFPLPLRALYRPLICHISSQLDSRRYSPASIARGFAHIWLFLRDLVPHRPVPSPIGPLSPTSVPPCLPSRQGKCLAPAQRNIFLPFLGLFLQRETGPSAVHAPHRFAVFLLCPQPRCMLQVLVVFSHLPIQLRIIYVLKWRSSAVSSSGVNHKL